MEKERGRERERWKGEGERQEVGRERESEVPIFLHFYPIYQAPTLSLSQNTEHGRATNVYWMKSPRHLNQGLSSIPECLEALKTVLRQHSTPDWYFSFKKAFAGDFNAQPGCRTID